ncbi:LPS export ABC transporter periplasmic protein LptC [Shewanella aestuarii]|uniref:Lipopolysaccharide export system protein LptC n=1 Tax=Shewanella aestuarii TaxID=1028752 RepID=A0A6G9QI02_9GAMM|nr:LPS export ABC transporter periplasmic protein LptC [Shewanella aestuarii]QIR13511.1 LPS export ABC transporter periplasmic protein LptC [Shewanella aestuarii]
MSRSTLAICAFFGLALALYWQVQLKRSQMDLTKSNNIERPDYIAQDLKTTVFNEQGYIDNKMTAKHMEHYASNNKTLFTEPVLLIYPENGEALWQLTAEKAILDQDINEVSLLNNVIIDAIDMTEPLQSLSTEQMTMDLETMIGRSEEWVLLKGNGFQIKGLGLHAELNAEQITLLSQVEGTYEPN